MTNEEIMQFKCNIFEDKLSEVMEEVYNIYSAADDQLQKYAIHIVERLGNGDIKEYGRI
ncbi:MAG: hypothetical protein FWC41_00150 [Firmicutes bacterium]|nr:hypothetical protein [Bacillota bacterium]